MGEHLLASERSASQLSASERSVSEHAGERFLASERLKQRADFLRASGGGHKVHSARFLFLVHPRGDGGPSRLGITVTRKVANAVGRNRIKRVLREVFRRNHTFFPTGCDVVVIAKDRAPGLAYEDTRSEIESTAASLLRAGKRPPRTEAPRSGGPRNQTAGAPVRGATTQAETGAATTSTSEKRR